MKFAKLLSACVFVGLTTACSEKDPTRIVTGNGPQDDGYTKPNPDHFQNYQISANLDLVYTNSELAKVSVKKTAIKGQGTKSTYVVHYKFNSGTNQSFKLMLDRVTNDESSECRGNEHTKMYTLKTGDDARVFTPGEVIGIEPKKDYILDVQLLHNCDGVKLDQEVMAWLGKDGEQPMFATVCRGEKTPQMTFFFGNPALRGYSSSAGKFLGDAVYCGENFPETKLQCERDSGIDNKLMVSCKSTADTETRMYKIRADFSKKTTTVNCTKNDQKSFHEEFVDCQSRVVDFAIYNK